MEVIGTLVASLGIGWAIYTMARCVCELWETRRK